MAGKDKEGAGDVVLSVGSGSANPGRILNSGMAVARIGRDRCRECPQVMYLGLCLDRLTEQVSRETM